MSDYSGVLKIIKDINVKDVIDQNYYFSYQNCINRPSPSSRGKSPIELLSLQGDWSLSGLGGSFFGFLLGDP
jgi:hypothetical protein